MQAKFDARERDRLEVEAKVKRERAAEMAVLQKARGPPTPSLAEGDLAKMDVDAIMALQGGGQAAGA